MRFRRRTVATANLELLAQANDLSQYELRESEEACVVPVNGFVVL